MELHTFGHLLPIAKQLSEMKYNDRPYEKKMIHALKIY